MTDKELIEFAAKAYNDGYFFGFDKDGNGLLDPVVYSPFNPLTNDGDALRLAVALGLIVDVDCEEFQTTVDYTSNYEDRYVIEGHGIDASAATRLAITRAAAQIGKEME